MHYRFRLNWSEFGLKLKRYITSDDADSLQRMGTVIWGHVGGAKKEMVTELTIFSAHVANVWGTTDESYYQFTIKTC